MKNKKRIITTLGLLLIVIVGATFAYYTSNTSFENVFNAGKYKVTLTEEFVSPDNWVPGETIPKTVTAKNDGTVPAAVRISYTEQWTKEIDGVETDITSQVSPNPAIINFANQTDWTSSNGYYYYKYILEPTDETSSFISGVTLDPNLDSVTCTGEGNTKTCEAQNKASGAKYKLTFTIQTVQYDQYENVWQTNVEITEKPAEVISYQTRQVEGQITPGDVIGIGETEDFYVISSDSEKTVLLAKYNLLVGNIIENNDLIGQIQPSSAGYGLQSVDSLAGYTNENSNGNVAFSYASYWDDDEGELISPYNANGVSYFGEGDRLPYVYDNTYVTEPDFENDGWNTEGYSIAYYVELYKSKLIEMGAPSTITGRLLSWEEVYDASSLEDNGMSVLYDFQSFWIGSVYNPGGVMSIHTDGSGNGESNCENDYWFGVRPVIEIPTSELQ